jgi:hypothetical protein
VVKPGAKISSKQRQPQLADFGDEGLLLLSQFGLHVSALWVSLVIFEGKTWNEIQEGI